MPLSANEIVMEIKKGTFPPLRPRVPGSLVTSRGVHDLLEICWDEDPSQRPSFLRLRVLCTKLLGRTGDSIVDHLIRSIEKHAAELEHQVHDKMQQFMEEKRRSHEILSQMIPKSIAAMLMKGDAILPEAYHSTTVLFSHVNGFLELVTEAAAPAKTISLLNALYYVCDTVIEKFDVCKIETVKDAFMIVSGLPIRNGIAHAGEIASMALLMRSEISSMKTDIVSAIKLNLRVGIHSGSCVSGIVGTKMPRYCLFGDTINTSSRMESHGQAGRIQCSTSTKELLEKTGGFVLHSRGGIDIKGKGHMETFWLDGKYAA